MPPDARQRLFDNTARAMGNADRAIKERHVPGFGIFSTGVSASVIRLQARRLFKSAGRSMPRRAPNGHRAVANCSSTSAGSLGGESMADSNRLSSLLPAGSSSVPRTKSLLPSSGQGLAGVNVQTVSPSFSRAWPARRRPRLSATAR
ncbi:hypothetical protein [Variovorax sp. OV329]|uniref:hypothetical protein n=1 Tax=Variovorax sp. OV329 TaxID=1882825 RepID=UPI0020C8CD46|nr:hypothetical protein [Variovorax sp. OV329]